MDSFQTWWDCMKIDRVNMTEIPWNPNARVTHNKKKDGPLKNDKKASNLVQDPPINSGLNLKLQEVFENLQIDL